MGGPWSILHKKCHILFRSNMTPHCRTDTSATVWRGLGGGWSCWSVAAMWQDVPWVSTTVMVGNIIGEMALWILVCFQLNISLFFSAKRLAASTFPFIIFGESHVMGLVSWRGTRFLSTCCYWAWSWPQASGLHGNKSAPGVVNCDAFNNGIAFSLNKRWPQSTSCSHFPVQQELLQRGHWWGQAWILWNLFLNMTIYILHM